MKITWLHISDIHFNFKHNWRDCNSRSSFLRFLSNLFETDKHLKPDLIFCTGDVAFGEINNETLDNQYKQAEDFFDNLLRICGKDNTPLPKDRLYIVPGNHDVTRSEIDPDAQATLTQGTSNNPPFSANPTAQQ